jgi:hypothetical protein
MYYCTRNCLKFIYKQSREEKFQPNCLCRQGLLLNECITKCCQALVYSKVTLFANCVNFSYARRRCHNIHNLRTYVRLFLCLPCVSFSPMSVIEKYTKNTRFCLICNYVSKIIPALQSRCTRFRFAPLDQAHVLERLRFVVKEEG